MIHITLITACNCTRITKIKGDWDKVKDLQKHGMLVPCKYNTKSSILWDTREIQRTYRERKFIYDHTCNISQDDKDIFIELREELR